jgi:O-antigen ligase
MAACPIISTTRAGAFVATVNMGLAAIILWFAQPKGDYKSKMKILLYLGIALCGGALLGWKDLAPRLEPEQLEGGLDGRNSTYELARPMADEHPLFGTGPGTFEPLFQFYRIDPDEYWPAQLHNDWLETRITFGWLGSVFIAFALGTVLLRWFIPGGIEVGSPMALFLWIAVAGCLLHARFDFPFQIYSILFVFLLLCAILFNSSRRAAQRN